MNNTDKYQTLIEAAKQAQKFSQAKYSNFSVGAAIETEDGAVFTGCNVESSSYGLTICAERVALTKAISEGELSFKTIAIVGPENEHCSPCGACRQLLYDYAPQLKVVTTNGNDIQAHDLSSLLPFAFEEKQLKRK